MQEIEEAVKTLKETYDYAKEAPHIMHNENKEMYPDQNIDPQKSPASHEDPKKNLQENQKNPPWLFIGAFPGGDVYADKRIQENGDYKKIALVNKYGILWEPGGINTDASVRDQIFKCAEQKKKEYINKISQYAAIKDDIQREYVLGREYESLLDELPPSVVINADDHMTGLSLKERILQTYETLCSLHSSQNEKYLAQKLQEKEGIKRRKKPKTR